MSMTLTWNPPKLPIRKKAVHENTAGYAPIVHEGATLRSGGSIPPRPWMTSAYLGPYGDYKPLEAFADAFRRSNNLTTAFQATAVGANNVMRDLIRADVWPYDATTIRRNKQIVGPPKRNIVDLSGLLRAQQSVRYE